jgi:hypothetical protein
MISRIVSRCVLETSPKKEMTDSAISGSRGIL